MLYFINRLHHRKHEQSKTSLRILYPQLQLECNYLYMYTHSHTSERMLKVSSCANKHSPF